MEDGNSNGLVLPDVIVTKRNRTDSICGRIEDDCCRGTVKYFCRSRGHGFIVPENVRRHPIRSSAKECFLGCVRYARYTKYRKHTLADPCIPVYIL